MGTAFTDQLIMAFAAGTLSLLTRAISERVKGL